MKKLLLFDIDNTLIIGGPHGDRFERAIGNLHGLETKLEGDFQGYTDYLILAALLKDEGWTETQIEDAMPELLREIDAVHASTFRPEDITVLPGVRELLEALQTRGCVLGLITGNVEIIAERKLAAVDLWHYFTVGGYGSDPHTARADLVNVAAGRAGYADNLDNVYVFGDTPRDVKAAHDAGVTHSVGVINGFRDRQELLAARPELVLDDFRDTDAVLTAIGVS